LRTGRPLSKSSKSQKSKVENMKEIPEGLIASKEFVHHVTVEQRTIKTSQEAVQKYDKIQLTKSVK
jgi:hypothetical protein